MIYAGASATSNTLSLWMPQILKSFGLSNLETGSVEHDPLWPCVGVHDFLGAAGGQERERIWSTALPLGLTSLGFACTLLTGSLTLTLVLLSLVLLGNYAIKGPFFALATETLPPAAAAAGIAAINTLAHLGTGAITSVIGVLARQDGQLPGRAVAALRADGGRLPAGVLDRTRTDACRQSSVAVTPAE